MTKSNSKAATKAIAEAKASNKPAGSTNQALWVCGSIILLVGGGMAAWYFIKKKRTKNKLAAFSSKSSSRSSTSSSAAAGGFRCTSSEYPLIYGTCHPDVHVLQRYLKSQNMNLGKSGKNRDGVDGQFGALTQAAALQQLGKDRIESTDIEGIRKALNFVGA